MESRPRRRAAEKTWWRRNRGMIAFLLVAAAAFGALGREEQLRQDTEDSVRRSVVVQIERTQYRACVEQNKARAAANDSAGALRSFIEVVIRQAEKRVKTQTGQDRQITETGLNLYRELRDAQHVIPLVDCSQ